MKQWIRREGKKPKLNNGNLRLGVFRENATKLPLKGKKTESILKERYAATELLKKENLAAGKHADKCVFSLLFGRSQYNSSSAVLTHIHRGLEKREERGSCYADLKVFIRNTESE